MSKAERSRRYREKHKHLPEYQAKEKARKLKHFQAKPWYYNAWKGRHIACTPPWADRKAIEAIYKEAYELGMIVDHIIPLWTPTVCGLHVHYNLQIVTPSENTRKGSTYDSNPN